MRADLAGFFWASVSNRILPREHVVQHKIARLNDELMKILTGGEAAQLLARRGYDPAPTTPEEFGKYLNSEIARWTKAVKQFGIKTLD